MAVVCPKCGRGVPEGRPACIYCGASTDGAKKASPPLAGEPKDIRSAEDLQTLIQLASQARGQGRRDEAVRLMGRVFLEAALADVKRIMLMMGEVWLASIKPYVQAETLANSGKKIQEAADAAAVENNEKAISHLSAAVFGVPKDKPQHAGMDLMVMGLAGVLKSSRARTVESVYKALIDKASKAIATPGKTQEAVDALKQALALIPDPPVTPQDKARRQRIETFLAALDKGGKKGAASSDGDLELPTGGILPAGDAPKSPDAGGIELPTGDAPKASGTGDIELPAAGPSRAPEAGGIELPAGDAPKASETGGIELPAADAPKAPEAGGIELPTGGSETSPAAGERSWQQLADNGTRLYNEGKFAQALTCYERALELNADNGSLWYNKGNTLRMMKRPLEEALECYRKAAELEPKHRDAWNNLAIALGQLQRWLESEKAWDGLLKLEPGNVEAMAHKARCLHKLGRARESLELCDRALEAAPGSAKAWAIKSLALDALGRPEEAKEAFMKAAKLKGGATPKPLEQESSGGIELPTGEAPQAPETGGLELPASGDTAAPAKKDPDVFEDIVIPTRSASSAASDSAGRDSASSEDKPPELPPSQEPGADEDKRQAALLSNKAKRLNDEKRHDEALDLCEQALKLWTDFAGAWINKGGALGMLGRFEEALEAFTKATELDPKDPMAWANRALALAKLKRLREALPCVERALEIDPNHALATKIRQTIYGGLGKQSPN